jgi:hypothetical protein
MPQTLYHSLRKGASVLAMKFTELGKFIGHSVAFDGDSVNRATEPMF